MIGRQFAAELDEREGVAPGFAHDPIREHLAERTADNRAEQLARIPVIEPAQVEVRDPVDAHGRFGRLAHREQQRDPIRVHAAGDEGQDVDRLPIDPLRVVDDAQQRTFARRVAEQCQRRQPDEEDVPAPVAAQPERRFQGLPLRFGQPVARRQEREEEAVQRGEPHPHLRLDAGDSEHDEIVGARDCFVEERRLPDAGFAPQYECTGPAGSGRVDNSLDRRTLPTATEKHEATVTISALSGTRGTRRPSAAGDYALSGIHAALRSFMLVAEPHRRRGATAWTLSAPPIPRTTQLACPSPTATSSPRSEVGSWHRATPGGTRLARRGTSPPTSVPQLVALPLDADDVRAIVQHARDHEMGIAPQGTGHAAAALGSLAGTILLATRDMRGVEIDATRRIARVRAGTLWQEVTEATTPHGLYPLSGSSPNLGVVGYTLGGGLSWLARQHGLAANHVTAIELVTPDGELVRATPSEHTDLFWAVRGGGGSFGVVTALEFRLFPHREVYAGMFLWPYERHVDVLHAWCEWTRSAPEAVTTSLRIVALPAARRAAAVPVGPVGRHGRRCLHRRRRCVAARPSPACERSRPSSTRGGRRRPPR